MFPPEARAPGPPSWAVAVRIIFGLLLLADAALEYQGGTYQVFDGILYSNASVSPEPLRSVLVFAAQLVSSQPAIANGVLAGVEALLAGSVLLGVGAGLALPVSILLFLGIWIFGQGLGLPFAGGTTDLSSGLPYALLGLVLWRTHSWRRLSVWEWARPGGHPKASRVRAYRVAALVAIAGVALLTFLSVAAETGGPGLAGPPAVGGAVMVLDTHLNQDLLFGGCGQLGCSNQTWVWRGRGWTRISGGGPPALGYAGAAFHPGLGEVVMFGGAASQGLGPALSSTWVWKGSWSRVGSGSSASGRRFPAVAYDPVTRQLLMFGGDSAGGTPLGGTFVWGPGGWRQLHPFSAPSPRTAAAMAWDPSRAELVLYGGSDEAGRLSDTWAWTGSDWVELTRASAPGPLAYAGMATDPETGTVLLYSGAGSSRSTWELGGRGWVPVGEGPGPDVYSFQAMAAAPLARGVLLYGGGTSRGSGFSSTTWLFSGSRWRRVAG